MTGTKPIKHQSSKLTEAKARLIAHLIGDGCVYQSRTDYNIKYQVIDEDLLEQFEADLVNVYGLPTTRGTKQSGKTERMVPFVRLRSKRAFDDLRKYCDYYSAMWSVPSKIFNSQNRIKVEFLKALFDDEGSVIPKGKSAELRLYSINERGLIQVQELLNEFGIITKIQGGYGMRRNVYAIITKDLQRFYSKIGFHCQRKQTKLERYMKVGENAHPFLQSPSSRI